MQQVVRAYGSEGQPNRFAVFSLAYRRSDDGDAVEGTAYDAEGKEHARWESVDVVHFAKDGRVEHVSLNVNLEFNIVRVTGRWLRAQGLGAFEPEALRDPGARDTFAAAYAGTLPRRA